MDFYSLELPLPELVSVYSHGALLIFSLSLASAKWVLSCALGGVPLLKDDHLNPLLLHGTEKVLFTSWFKVSAFCCFYVLLLQIIGLGYEAVKDIESTLNYYVLCVPLIQSLAWTVLSLWVFRCKLKSLAKFPLLVRLWWFLSFCIGLFASYFDTNRLLKKFSSLSSHIFLNYACVPALAFLCLASFRGVTGIELYRDHEILQEEEDVGYLKVTPYSKAGFFSLTTFSWLNPLLSIGAKKPIVLSDIPLLAPHDCSKTSFKILNSNWERLKDETFKKQPSLVMAIFLSFWKEAAVNAVFAVASTLVSYVGPYLIGYFVDYLGGNEAFPHEGYIIASILSVAKLLENVTTRQWYLGVDLLGMHVRSALTAMVYQKGLRLSSTARQSRTSGEIVNYMAVDVQRVGDYSWYIHDIWMLPVQIILALAILYKNVGIATIATLIATTVSIIVTIPLAKLQETYQDKLMAAKDVRMRKTTECLRNMRILKLQAWEDRYRLAIEEMRNVEFKWLRKTLFSQAAITFIFWASPIFVSVLTFASCILLGGQLTAGRVLSALATFRVLQDPLRNVPDLVSMIAQTKVSINRLSAFLHEEELQKDAIITVPQGTTNLAIEIKDGEFSWDLTSSPTLSSIQLKVEKGMHVAVCGMVGSGKSSFLSCILGEIPKVSGEVKLSGSTAYVPQSAWIQSGNIEENILFGSPMDENRYKSVLQACSLIKDLELLPNGDKTIIGDRGVNLSGGQKQRVQLARALYQDADIYLLDDPFSAVDAHTGSELFKNCILSALGSKTVVYVTHQIEFLPTADMILVLKDGHITQAGKYTELLQSGTGFCTLVSAHNDTIQSLDVMESTSSEISATVQSGSVIRRLASTISSVDAMNSRSSEHRKAVKDKKKGKPEKLLVQEEEHERGKVSLKVYFSYMTAAYKGILIPPIILAQVTFQVLQIASNWWMAWANPQTKGDKPKTSTMVLLVVYVILAFGSSWFVFIRAILVAMFGLAASQKMFIKMQKTIFRAPMSFFDSTPSGRILNRVSTDQSVVDLDIPFRLGGFVATTIQLLGIVAVMSNVTWHVLVLFFPTVIACLWMQNHHMASSRELVRIVSIQKSPIIHHFGESIAGAATIRSFNQEKRFMKRNLQLLDSFSRPLFCNLAAIEWLCLRMELLSTVVFAFCLILLVSFPHGTIHPSVAGLAVTYGLNLNARLARWILSFCKLENKVISLERIHQYCQLPVEAPPIIECCRPPNSWPKDGKIELIDLKVRYKESLPMVLHGITCTFPGGKKIGIVGRTGSGKSTIVQTLFRLIEPASGKIIIDNIDITTIGLHDLRARLSIIPQEPTLFEGTIRVNLDPIEEHSDYMIWQALEKCQLREVVQNKVHKLDTPVLENGDNWSVGQRQLLCLGRVLLKQARILVLDEATASMDTALDTVIQKIIRTEFRDCTVCMIAHRIPTIVDSDLVLVLDNGRVAEFGSPQSLLEDKSSMFQKLVTEYSTRSIRMSNA